MSTAEDWFMMEKLSTYWATAQPTHVAASIQIPVKGNDDSNPTAGTLGCSSHGVMPVPGVSVEYVVPGSHPEYKDPRALTCAATTRDFGGGH